MEVLFRLKSGTGSPLRKQLLFQYDENDAITQRTDEAEVLTASSSSLAFSDAAAAAAA